MGYFKRRYGGRPALGGVADVAQAAAELSTDPYLAETVCRLRQLKAIKNNEAPSPCIETAPGLVGGIGLRKAIRPLRAFVFAEQHPWAYALAAAVAIGVPVWIGYEIGRGSKP